MALNELKVLIDTGYFLAFVIAILIATLRLIFRILQYRKAKIKIPILVWRDLLFLLGLAIPFLAILSARVIGITEIVRAEISWSIMTGTPAVVGAWSWVYFEYFRIDK